MLKLLVLSLLLASCYARNFPPVHRQNGRIVDGELADITEAPYQIATLKQSSSGSFRQYCGGSLIAPNIVLSAAHCTANTTASQWQMRAGSSLSNSGGSVTSVSRIVDHELYGGASKDYIYDITIYFLSSPFVIDNVRIGLIPLPAQNASVITGASAFITGWGYTVQGGQLSPELRKITIPIVEWSVCNEAHVSTGGITLTHICAGDIEDNSKDSCQGDSGGPLAINKVLYGVVSSGDGCAKPGKPGLYTNVPMFRNWIDSKITQY